MNDTTTTGILVAVIIVLAEVIKAFVTKAKRNGRSTDVHLIGKDVAILKTDVATVKSDVQWLRESQARLEGDVKSMRT